MKKKLVLFLLALVLLIPYSSQATEEQITIRIDEKILDIEDNIPFIKSGTTFIPLRVISESLGYEVGWDSANQIVTMKKDVITIELPVGKDIVKVNGKDTKIAQAALIKEKTTYVPVRFVSELIGYEVQYKKESGNIYIDINSPAFLIPTSNSEEDKFIKNYAKENKHELVQYIMSDINNDSILDYILLVHTDVGYEDEIILVDGQSKNKLAKTTVMRSMETPALEVKRVTGPKDKQIYYYGHDGYAHEYIFNYDSGTLKNIYRDIEDLKNVEHNYLFSYFIDYPNLNKVLGMKPTESILDYILMNSTFRNLEEKEQAFGYKPYIENMSTPGEIQVSYHLKVYPIEEAAKAILYHTYQWVDGKWEVKDAKIEQLGTDYIVTESKYTNSNEYSSWCKDGVLNITKGNIEKLFKASKNEIVKICGKPNKIDTFSYAPNDKLYRYNGFTIGYIGGNNKYPWGPSYIQLNGGDSKVLSTKVGMSLKEVKNILGKPDDEGTSELDGLYNLTYNLNDYYILYIAPNSNSKVVEIMIKENPVQ